MTQIRDADDEETLSRQLIDLLDTHAFSAGYPFEPALHGLRAIRDGAFVGGAQYHLNYGWCFLKLLAVDPSARGHGVGSALMAALETRMRARNAAGIWLDTYGFQAAPFYLGHGYEEFARLPGPVPDQDRIFMRKTLGDEP